MLARASGYSGVELTWKWNLPSILATMAVLAAVYAILTSRIFMSGGNPGSPGRPPSRQQGQPALGHRRQPPQIMSHPRTGHTPAPGAARPPRRTGWSGREILPTLWSAARLYATTL